MAALAGIVLQPLFQDLPYKGPDDMTLIAQVNEAPTALAVSASAPWRTLEEIVVEASRRPGQLSVGLGAGLHTILHVQLALLEKGAGVRFSAIPFEAGAQLPALLGGSIDAAIGQTVLLSPQLRAGKLRALAQSGIRRQKGWESVPTFKDRGFDITLVPYEFVIAPKGVPRPVVEKLTSAFKRATESAAFKEFADRRGLEVRYLGALELRERLLTDGKVLRQVVEDFGWPKKK
jgi:tripartite-type tricarboxylate transporter receptor subunit TctC